MTENILHARVLNHGAGGRKDMDVLADANGVFIRPEGTGDSVSTKDAGWPVLVEFMEGIPRVVIWADINQEEPTHIVDLSSSMEKRKDE